MQNNIFSDNKWSSAMFFTLINIYKVSESLVFIALELFTRKELCRNLFFIKLQAFSLQLSLKKDSALVPSCRDFTHVQI